MQTIESSIEESSLPLAKAEIAFAHLPVPMDLFRTLRSLCSREGILKIQFNLNVNRISILFDPVKLDTSFILSTLEPLRPDPRVISLVVPKIKERPEIHRLGEAAVGRSPLCL